MASRFPGRSRPSADERDPGVNGALATPAPVSIHALICRRARPLTALFLRRHCEFQSTRAPEDERDNPAAGCSTSLPGFNPRAHPQMSATLHLAAAGRDHLVSIHAPVRRRARRRTAMRRHPGGSFNPRARQKTSATLGQRAASPVGRHVSIHAPVRRRARPATPGPAATGRDVSIHAPVRRRARPNVLCPFLYLSSFQSTRPSEDERDTSWPRCASR